MMRGGIEGKPEAGCEARFCGSAESLGHRGNSTDKVGQKDALGSFPGADGAEMSRHFGKEI